MKTYQVAYSSGARKDLAELEDYIEAQSSAEIARIYIAELLRECDSLGFSPHRGTKRSDLRPTMRVTGYKRAVTILFRVEEVERRVVILGAAYRGRSVTRIVDRDE